VNRSPLATQNRSSKKRKKNREKGSRERRPLKNAHLENSKKKCEKRADERRRQIRVWREGSTHRGGIIPRNGGGKVWGEVGETTSYAKPKQQSTPRNKKFEKGEGRANAPRIEGGKLGGEITCGGPPQQKKRRRPCRLQNPNSTKGRKNTTIPDE